jgi:hypothetical protein
VEGGEVKRYVGAEFFAYPVGEFLDFGRAVVLAGNQKGGDLQPAVSLVVNVSEDVEDGLQVGDAELVIEAVGECFEIDIGGIHDGEKLAGWFRVDIAGSHRDIADAQLATGKRGVDGVFGEDHRVVVGVGNGVGTVAFGSLGNGLRAGAVHQAIHVF